MDKSNEKKVEQNKDGEFLAKLFVFFEQNLNHIKDDKLKAILKKVLITEFFLFMTNDKNDSPKVYIKDKEVTAMVTVPLNVYIEFQKKFNNGELFVYSGRKDGTNRKIGRNNKGILKDMTGGATVWPFELYMLFADGNSVGLSEFGKKMNTAYNTTNISNFTYLYNDNKDVIGIKFADGSEIKM